MTFEEHIASIRNAGIAYNDAVQRAAVDGFKVESQLCSKREKLVDMIISKRASDV